MGMILSAGDGPALETAPPAPAHWSTLHVAPALVMVPWLEMENFAVILNLGYCLVVIL